MTNATAHFFLEETPWYRDSHRARGPVARVAEKRVGHIGYRAAYSMLKISAAGAVLAASAQAFNPACISLRMSGSTGSDIEQINRKQVLQGVCTAASLAMLPEVAGAGKISITLIVLRVRAYVRACVRACVRVCVCVRACARARPLYHFPTQHSPQR